MPRALASTCALLLLLVHARTGHAQSQPATSCTVRGGSVNLDAVTVTPADGVAPFELRVRALPVSAGLPTDATGAPVRVDGALTFEARATRGVPWAIARSVMGASGIVTFDPAASVTSVRAARGNDAVITASIGYGVRVEGATVACDALTLDAPVRPAERRTSTPNPRGDGTYWIPRGASLVFYSAPGSGDHVRVHADNPVLLSMTRIVARGPWAGVYFRGQSGMELNGWVLQSQLRPMPVGSVGGYPSGIGHIGCRGARVTGTRVYRGPATIAAGTDVLAEPGRGAWARVSREVNITVMRIGDEPFVRLIEVPGLASPSACDQLMHALVPVSAVTLPPGVSWP